MSEGIDSHVHAGLANLQPVGKDWSFGFCHAVEDAFHWGLGLYSKKCVYIYISKTKKNPHKTTKQTKQCKVTTESKHQQKKQANPTKPRNNLSLTHTHPENQSKRKPRLDVFYSSNFSTGVLHHNLLSTKICSL